MKLLTQRTIIQNVVTRWMRQYPCDQNGVGAKLRTLGLDTCPPAAVDAIIGNNSWTRLPDCDECGAQGVPVAVEVGQKPDYESNTATLCAGCLKSAAALAESVSGERSHG